MAIQEDCLSCQDFKGRERGEAEKLRSVVDSEGVGMRGAPSPHHRTGVPRMKTNLNKLIIYRAPSFVGNMYVRRCAYLRVSMNIASRSHSV